MVLTLNSGLPQGAEALLISNLAFSADSTRIAAVSRDGVVYIFNTANGSLIQKYQLPHRPTRSRIGFKENEFIVAYTYSDFEANNRGTDVWLWAINQ